MTSSTNAPPPKKEPDTRSSTSALDNDKTDNSNTSHPVATDEQAETRRDDENIEGDKEAGAQLPEPEITMTSPSPDVVIATVETPDPQTKLSMEVLKSETQNQNGAQTIDQEADAEQNPIPEQADNTSADSINSAENSDNVDNSADSNNNMPHDEEATKKDLDTALPTDDENLNNDNDNELSEAEKIEAEEQEEVKEEKESKLESYKQFVAEQFSKQKIDYPEIRVTIEANALPSKMYFVMNVLSAIIASYGLIANSAAVVIGAMLVAMMLGPITGVALAIIDYRMPLLRKSLFTVAAGGFLVIFVGFVVGWLHKGQPLTAEVLSRTQPTSMDLMIALAGGTAGVYAMVSPHLSVAVVGVAVATALVPPLASSGILFANGEMTLGFGAALLALTNIIAIQFTNAMVLWFLGFRRLVDDDYKSNTHLTFLRRNAVTLLLLIGLGIYLTINLNTNARQQTFENNVKETVNSYFKSKGNVLTNTQFNRANGNEVVRAVIRGETTPSSYDVRQIEATITQDMADNFPKYLPVKLQLRYLPVQVIESDPMIQDKLDQTDAAILTN
ncbi:TIGR00341 family protein [Psychrobacter sp. LV10R520-6]|uniref:TIGR00341 family protein n=1 Tax=Psychrobacter sp. LV10R520-6 TaxID=1415574 RepID=UPI0024C7524E|nr:TIGR00341 family protein [Psychrobacter sp. LV10R520-6]SNT69487.1 TIGR00341 family protein [Psychrobacter sp. LV10R520-6]